MLMELDKLTLMNSLYTAFKKHLKYNMEKMNLKKNQKKRLK